MNHIVRFSIVGLLLAGAVWWLVATKSRPEVSIPEPQLGNSALRIIENQGQWDARIRYKVPLNGGDIFLEQNRLTYAMYHMPAHGHQNEHPGHDHHRDSVKGHVFRVTFLGANAQPVLQPGLHYPEYHNYYLSDNAAEWATEVPLYGLMTYQSLWPGVDFRVYGYGDALKYDFILAPGTDPATVSLAYEGLDDITLRNDTLILNTAVRTLTEYPPVAYQPDGGEKIIVPCEYVLKDGVLRYAFPEGYDATLPLIIDPTLVFSTYTGSFSDNWGFTATYDTAGFAYAGGTQFGTTSIFGGYPTVGAFQTQFNGGESDATITKFTPNGTGVIFSTYLGGNNGDQPHSLVVNSDDELIVFGRTNSPNFPTLSGYDNTHNGDWDIFLTKFSPTGALVASTYVGGSGSDGVNVSEVATDYSATKYNYGDDARGEVIVDANNQVYVAAPTRSGNFPVTVGTGIVSGNQDGVVFRLSANLGALTWSRLFGGLGSDAAHTIKMEPGTGNVIIAGGTSSPNLPTSGNAYQPNISGGVDGFIAKLIPGTNLTIACTYLGTTSFDQIYLMDTDEDGFIYVGGQTEGAWPIINPAAGPVYRNTGAKQFIVKLDNVLGGIDYSTTFGSVNAAFPNISPTAFLVDVCENVYMTGWGGVTNSGTGSPGQGTTQGMAVTPDAFKSTTDGSDFYLIVLDRDAQNLLYGSYFGGNNSFNGDHVDGGTSRFDKNGVVYHAVCASCGGTNAFPAQPGGVYSTTNNSSNCNLAVFKLAFDLSGVEADFVPRDQFNQIIVDTEGCAPLEVRFDNQSFVGGTPGQTQWFWDFDDNGASSNQFEPIHTFNDPGTYEVMLIITDSSSCNIADTAFRTITVFPPPAVDVGPDQTICEGDTFDLQSLTTGVSYQWSPTTDFITSDTIPNPSAVANQSRSYILTLTDAQGCTAEDTVNISVDNSLEVFARNDTLVCRGGSVRLNVSSTNGISYLWSATPGASISDPTATNPLVTNLDTTTQFVVLSENALGCPETDTMNVTVFEVFTQEDTTICLGDTIPLQTSNGINFVWTPNDGSISDTSVSSPFVFPITNTVYSVVGTSAEGCISEKDVLVEVRENPVAVAAPDTAICIGETVTLQGSGSIAYSWSPANLVSDPFAPTPTTSPDTTTTFSLTVTDPFGCSGTDSVTVVILPLPEVAAGDDQIICQGEAAQLQATGAQTYQWLPGNLVTDPNIADTLAVTAATVELTLVGIDEFGCQNQDSILIEVIPRPVTEVDGVNRLCIGGSIELTANGGDRYEWNTGDTTRTIFVAPNTPTTYIATAFIGGCAGIPDSITVDQFFDYPEADFTLDPDSGWAPQEIQFTNLSTGALTYDWNFGFGRETSMAENPSFVYPARGTYVVTLIAFSPQGCADTAQQTVYLDNVALHVPSGFTPNNNGPNDNWRVGYVGIGEFNVQVFSRWGLKIFESDNKDFLWNGTYQGRDVPEGVYVYVIRARGENGQPFERSGTVTLVR